MLQHEPCRAALVRRREKRGFSPVRGCASQMPRDRNVIGAPGSGAVSPQNGFAWQALAARERVLVIPRFGVTLLPSMKTDPSLPETVDIEAIAPGGDGVARLADGQTVFVAATAPGDRIRLAALRRQQGVLFGEQFELIAPGPDRVVPPCPYAQACGGCDFMHLSRVAQLREKQRILEDTLTRIGRVKLPMPAIRTVQAPNDLAYRSRLRLHVDKVGNVGYEAARSNRLIPIERCLVALPRLNIVLQALFQLDEAGKRKLSFCEEIELRETDIAPFVSVRLIARKGKTLKAEVYAPLFPADSLVVIADSTEDKQLCQSVQITDDVTLEVPIGSFSQVHRDINRDLVKAVVAGATLRHHKSFLDAYAGAGNFALPLLKAGLFGEAVDQGQAGILAARRVARDLGLPFAGFSIGDAKRVLELFVKNKRQFDYVVLDPPRKGAKIVLPLVLKLKPRTIALVGCDPVSLSRDLGELTALGSTVESITMFDMFPQTHHSETLAILDTGSH